MKKIIYVAFIVGSLTFTSCSLSTMVKMAKDQELVVNPNPLELHGDSVRFDMSATLPVKMLKKGKVYTVNTFYKYGETELELGGVEFNANDYPDAATTQPRVTESFAFAYEPSMSTPGAVEIQGVASDPKNGKSKSTERLPVATGIIATSNLVEAVYFPAYADHGYNNQEELEPTNVNFYFEQGRSRLRSTLKTDGTTNRDKQSNLSAFIADKNVTRTVTITGTHSPEGKETINSELSQDRAEEIEKFYRAQMDKYDYEGAADSIRFILKPIVEDWTDFKSALQNYDGVSSDAKSEMLSIVNGPGVFEDKEKRLREVEGYKMVFKDLYPGLRSAKTEILTVKPKKTDAQISVLAKQITQSQVSADTLSIEELMYAATLTPDLKEKEAIYKSAIDKADSWNAHNNLAAVYVAMAMENMDNSYVEMAQTQVELAQRKEESAEGFVNQANVYLMQGNKAAAREAAGKANAKGPVGELSRGLNGVAGSADIMLANYDEAARELSAAEQTSDNLFNKGLAYLLNKDYSNAISAFDESISADGSNAKAYYGSAVAHARQNNEDKVVEMLTKAIDNDPELKERAATDLEFANYTSSTAFQGALN